MQRSNLWPASAVLDKRVHNAAGENLGKIEDIVIDPITGNIEYAILSFGGLLGMGDRLYPVPWSSLNPGPSGDFVVFDADEDRLRRAPAFERDRWPDLRDPIWRRNIDDYYGGPRTVTTRPVYVERPVARPGTPILSALLLLVLILGLAWLTYLVATRGWDQAREDIKGSFQRIVYAAKETSTDAALTTKVKTALALSKRIPADRISVESDRDIVTLRGDVPSNEVRRLAESIAGDVPGVSEVRNHLFVINRSE
jgi:sporulation protein YlmC with PRC-barrel domain